MFCTPRSQQAITCRVQGSLRLRSHSLSNISNKLAPGSCVRVHWPIDDAWYPGEMGDTDAYRMPRVAHDGDDEEQLKLSKEQCRVVPLAKGERCREERWENELAAFRQFCVTEGGSWLSATEAKVRLYVAQLMSKGTIKAASLKPYLSAINNYHEGMDYNGPAKGCSASRAVKGMASLQVEAADAPDEAETVQTWLPARHVTKMYAHGLAMQPTSSAEAELLWACTYYVVVAFVRWARDGFWQQASLSVNEASRDSYWILPCERGRLMSAQVNDGVQLGLGKLVCVPAEGGHFSLGHNSPRGACTSARAVRGCGI
ncbi:hypothetical protein CYMTET_43825 [Cymbomonas tetramitiformis]|uniref:Uncharacterized protein n=1 Tax=Cymbomonas tetramitiformis TaxID=36881 RepID=A0AAE0C3D0_9CHLO|nr:hypothetical protein CYMTET_43825 [Cymbomonas tetramitiformis]|eukprot:gene10897-biopygen11164